MVHPSSFVPNGPRLVVGATLGWLNRPLLSMWYDDDDLLETRLFPIDVNAANFVTLNRMGISGGPRKFWRCWSCSLRWGACLTPENTHLPSSVTTKLVTLGQIVGALLHRSSRQVWYFASRLSGSLEVVGTDTDWSAAYNFLLVFHSLSYTISEIKGNIFQIFSLPLFKAPAGGSP